MAPLLGSEEAGLGSVLTAAGGSQSGGPSTGDPVSIATFTGMIVGAEGTITSFLANPGTQQAFAEGVIELDPQLYPTSARTFEKLTATATNGNGGTPYTVTLYKNGAPTAQTVTVLAGAAAGTVFTDSVHPISFADGDKFDVVVSKAGSADSAAFMAVTLEGPDGSGGGSGDFPGYGPAPPGVLAASAAGVSALVSRADHTHGGVTSVAAGASGLMSVTPTAGSVIVDTGQLFVNGINTGASQLASLASANFNTGQACWVNSVGAFFDLQVSALAVDGITVVAASGSGARQWIRRQAPNRAFWRIATWHVDPVNGSDEASGTGTGANALKTAAEWTRRLTGAQLSTNITLNIDSDMPDADSIIVPVSGPGKFVLITGGQTVLATATVSVAQARSAAANQANEITSPTDFSSFVNRLIRVQGTANYAAILKSTGTDVVRLSELVNTTFGTIASATGITAGQTVEVVQTRKGPLRLLCTGDVQLFVTDLAIDGAGSNAFINFSVPTTGGASQFSRCIIGAQFGSMTSVQGAPAWVGGLVKCSVSVTLNGWSLVGPGLTTPQAISSLSLNQAAAYNLFISLVCQATEWIVGGGALQINGDMGVFDLAAGKIGVDLNYASVADDFAGSILKFKSGRFYGSGNNATATVWAIGVGSWVLYVAAQPPTMDAGNGVNISGGNVALGALPVALSLTNGSAVYAL